MFLVLMRNLFTGGVEGDVIIVLSQNPEVLQPASLHCGGWTSSLAAADQDGHGALRRALVEYLAPARQRTCKSMLPSRAGPSTRLASRCQRATRHTPVLDG